MGVAQRILASAMVAFTLRTCWMSTAKRLDESTIKRDGAVAIAPV